VCSPAGTTTPRNWTLVAFIWAGKPSTVAGQARIEAVAQHQQRRCSALGSNLYPFGLVGEEFCLVGRPAGWAPSRVPSTGVRVPAEERTASMAVSGDR
jgi:hypothetical protein